MWISVLTIVGVAALVLGSVGLWVSLNNRRDDRRDGRS